MSIGLVIAVTLIYTAIGFSQLHDGRPGLAITFFCYAGANVGLIMEMKS